MLALLADTRRDPPHRRVKEQQRLGNGLSDVDRVIPPADSGASSCAISASIWCGARPVRAVTGKKMIAHRADHAWRVDERGFDDAKADVEAKLSRQALTVHCHGDSGS